MHYYERHLGDYAKDTGHLSALEHGVYTLLLDRYYSTEQGIPDNWVYRIAKAKSKEEIAAVQIILEEFFCLVDGVWINKRADEEITKAQTKIKAAQQNGKRGGRPKCKPNETQQKPTGLFVGYENETQQKAYQPPDTNHQTPVGLNNTYLTSQVVGNLTGAEVCLAMRELGMINTNPQHPELLELIDRGKNLRDFVSAGTEAIQRGKGFAYMLGIVKNQKLTEQGGCYDGKNSNGNHRKSLAEIADEQVRRADELAAAAEQISVIEYGECQANPGDDAVLAQDDSHLRPQMDGSHGS